MVPLRVAEDLSVGGGAGAPAPVGERGLRIRVLLERHLAAAPAGVEHHALEALEDDATLGHRRHGGGLLDDGAGHAADESRRADFHNPYGVQADRDQASGGLRVEPQPARPREQEERPRARDRRVAVRRSAEPLVDEELPGGQERVRALTVPRVRRVDQDGARPAALRGGPRREAHDQDVDPVRALDALGIPGVEVWAHRIRCGGSRGRPGGRGEQHQGQEREDGSRPCSLASVRPRGDVKPPCDGSRAHFSSRIAGASTSSQAARLRGVRSRACPDATRGLADRTRARRGVHARIPGALTVAWAGGSVSRPRWPSGRRRSGRAGPPFALEDLRPVGSRGPRHPAPPEHAPVDRGGRRGSPGAEPGPRWAWRGRAGWPRTEPLRWKVNSWVGQEVGVPVPCPGVPARQSPVEVVQLISIRCWRPVVRPVVVMSMVRSVSSACSTRYPSPFQVQRPARLPVNPGRPGPCGAPTVVESFRCGRRPPRPPQCAEVERDDLDRRGT